MAMTQTEILEGLGEIVEEVAGVPADQVDAASPPSGVVAPSPVTTTLTRSLLPTATPPVLQMFSRGEPPYPGDPSRGSGQARVWLVTSSWRRS